MIVAQDSYVSQKKKKKQISMNPEMYNACMTRACRPQGCPQEYELKKKST